MMSAGRKSYQWSSKRNHQFYVRSVRWLLSGLKHDWNRKKPKRKCLKTWTRFVRAFLVPQESQSSTAITSKTCQMLHSQLEATPSLSPLNRFKKNIYILLILLPENVLFSYIYSMFSVVIRFSTFSKLE